MIFMIISSYQFEPYNVCCVYNVATVYYSGGINNKFKINNYDITVILVNNNHQYCPHLKQKVTSKTDSHHCSRWAEPK